MTKTSTQAPPLWRCVDNKPESNGWSCGDWQVTEDLTVRFVLTNEPPDGLHGIVTETWYAEHYGDGDDTEPPFGVMCRIEYMVCSDPDEPGATEVWSDYEYDDGADVLSYETVEAAEEAVKRAAQRSIAYSAPMYTWDGRRVIR